MSQTSLQLFEVDVQRACTAGDHQAAATLILEQLGPAVMRLIHARFGHVDASAEVFSRFAESMWVGLPQFAFRCSVRAWVFTLVRNAGNRYLDRELRRERRGMPLSEAPELAAQVARLRTATLQHLRTENRDRLAELRATLSEPDQLLLSLRLGQALEFREIAQVFLGEDEHAPERIEREAARLRKRLQLIKNDLRKRLAAHAPDHSSS